VPFTNHSIDVEEGDMLYVFSDGFIDQFGGPKGKRYMSKRFKDLLTSMAEEKVAVQSELLQKELTSWQGEEQQLDDILVIGVRI
jgi:serine phosphatase RsbU (regulator of sigma subunit)